MSAELHIHVRPSIARFVAATLVGSLAGAAALLCLAMLFDLQEWAAYQQQMPLWQALGSVYLAVLAGGVLPTLAIGATLMALKRASAGTLVLTPALLFAMVLVQVGRATAGLMMPLAAALLFGGLVMLLLLARARPRPRPDIASIFA